MISMPRFSAYSQILSDWLWVEYYWCSVDMLTYCAAQNSAISPLLSNSAFDPYSIRSDVCVDGEEYQADSVGIFHYNNVLGDDNHEIFIKMSPNPGEPYLHPFNFERYMSGRVLMRVRNDIPRSWHKLVSGAA